LACSASMEF